MTPATADPHQLKRDIYERTAPKLTPEVLRDGRLTKTGLLIAGNADAIVCHLPNYSWTH